MPDVLNGFVDENVNRILNNVQYRAKKELSAVHNQHERRGPPADSSGCFGIEIEHCLLKGASS
jgi:hypothetical protein